MAASSPSSSSSSASYNAPTRSPAVSPSTSDKARVDQILSEFFSKSQHVILSARIPGLFVHPPDSARPPPDRWFNLEFQEVSSTVLHHASTWRHSTSHPMVIDILLHQPPPEPTIIASASSTGSTDATLGPVEGTFTLLERWTVVYERRGWKGKGSGQQQDSVVRDMEPPVVYKYALILLRSLYAILRILPAHKLFLMASPKVHSYSLAYRIGASPTPISPQDSTASSTWRLAPVATPAGRLCVSVMYRRDATPVTVSEVPSVLAPHVITDYVGSPSHGPATEVSRQLVNPRAAYASRLAAPVRWSPPVTSPSSAPCTLTLGGMRPTAGFYKYPSPSTVHHPPSIIPTPSPGPSPSPSPRHTLPQSLSVPGEVKTHSTRSGLTPGLEGLQQPWFAPHSLPRLQTTPTAIRGGKAQGLPRTESSPQISHGKQQIGFVIPSQVNATLAEGKMSSQTDSEASVPASEQGLARLQLADEDVELSFPFAVHSMEDTVTGPQRHRSRSAGASSGVPSGLGGPLSGRQHSQDAALGVLVRTLKSAAPLRSGIFQGTSSGNFQCVLEDNPQPMKKVVSGLTLDILGSESGVLQERLSVAEREAPNLFPPSVSGSQVRRTSSEALKELRQYSDMRQALLRQRGKGVDDK